MAAAALRLARRLVVGGGGGVGGAESATGGGGASAFGAKYGPVEHVPGAALTSDEDLATAAGDIATSIFHPVGTARLGRAAYSGPGGARPADPGDPGAVVDSQLRVLGVAGLRVADASVMPTITSGNTNSPTLAIAEKAARLIMGP